MEAEHTHIHHLSTDCALVWVITELGVRNDLESLTTRQLCHFMVPTARPSIYVKPKPNGGWCTDINRVST